MARARGIRHDARGERRQTRSRKAARKKRACMFPQVQPTAPAEPWILPAWRDNSCPEICGKASSTGTPWPKPVTVAVYGRGFSCQILKAGVAVRRAVFQVDMAISTPFRG